VFIEHWVCMPGHCVVCLKLPPFHTSVTT
jgi:hypothetical protein